MSTVMSAVTEAHTLEPRIKNAVFLLPDVLPALLAVNKAASPEGLPPVTIKLIHLRASQINGCAVCCDMHARELKTAGEPDKKIHTVAAWREARGLPRRNARRWPSPKRSRAWPTGPKR